MYELATLILLLYVIIMAFDYEWRYFPFGKYDDNSDRFHYPLISAMRTRRSNS